MHLWPAIRRCRFSLMSLLIVLTIVGVLCSIWATMKNAADARDCAAAALEARGVLLMGDVQSDAGIIELLLPRSRWRRVEGIYFRRYTGDVTHWHGGQPWYGGMSLAEIERRGLDTLTDQDLENLFHFNEVENLSLPYCEVRGRYHSIAASLPHIRRLILLGSDTDDNAIAHLSRLSDIESLDLRETDVTDKCVPALLRMRKLKYLGIEGTGFTTQGILRLGPAVTGGLRLE